MANSNKTPGTILEGSGAHAAAVMLPPPPPDYGDPAIAQPDYGAHLDDCNTSEAAAAAAAAAQAVGLNVAGAADGTAEADFRDPPRGTAATAAALPNGGAATAAAREAALLERHANISTTAAECLYGNPRRASGIGTGTGTVPAAAAAAASTARVAAAWHPQESRNSWRDVLEQSTEGRKALQTWQLKHLYAYLGKAGIVDATTVCMVLNEVLKLCSLEQIRDASQSMVAEACRQLALYAQDAKEIQKFKLAVADIGAINKAVQDTPTPQLAHQHARIKVCGAGVADVNGYYAIDHVDADTNQVVYGKIKKNGVPAISLLAEETGRVLVRFVRDGRDLEGEVARSGNWVIQLSSATSNTYLYWQQGNARAGYRLCTPDVVGSSTPARAYLQWRVGRLPGADGFTTFNVPGTSLANLPTVVDYYPSTLE